MLSNKDSKVDVLIFHKLYCSSQNCKICCCNCYILNSGFLELGKKLPPPTKTTTPYGGRLTWCLPGGNPLTLHLKDCKLVRQKKRWSQVICLFVFFV